PNDSFSLLSLFTVTFEIRTGSFLLFCFVKNTDQISTIIFQTYNVRPHVDKLITQLCQFLKVSVPTYRPGKFAMLSCYIGNAFAGFGYFRVIPLSGCADTLTKIPRTEKQHIITF